MDEHSRELRVIDVGWICWAFRVVALANWYFLALCGPILLGGVGQLVRGARAVDAASVADGLALGLCVVVGWRGTGNLIAVVRRSNLALLSALVLLSVAKLMNVLPAASVDRDGERLLMGSMATFALVDLLALGVLTLIPIRPLGLKLHRFLKEALRPGPQWTRLASVDPPKRFASGAAGIALLWVGFFVPTNIPSWVITTLGFGCLVLARKYSQPSFAAVLANDSRAPVLYLRSFRDDEEIGWRPFTAALALFDFSLESRLGAYFANFGPFIAVASPGDTAPALGAARAPLAKDEWQSQVLRWLKDSSLVVVLTGGTTWVEWEIRKIAELGHAPKALFVFPETGFWRAREDEHRLLLLQKIFSDTCWGRSLARLAPVKHYTDARGRIVGTLPMNIRCIALLESGSVVVITSSPRNRESYHLATLLAHYLQRESKQRGDVVRVNSSIA